MKTMMVLIFALGLAGCQEKATSYYCLTPLGWASFDSASSKVRFGLRGVTVESEAETLTFTSCVIQRSK